MNISGSIRGTVPRAGARLERTLSACHVHPRVRRAAHAVPGERRAEMTAVLRRLAEGHVPLASVIPLGRNEGALVEFTDGTRLLLGIRYGGDGMEQLEPAGSGLLAWLAEARPCFGHRWYWLWFTSAGCTVSVEVLTSVLPAPPDSPAGRGSSHYPFGA